MSLPFRADGVDILDILASGVPRDFRNQVDLPCNRRCDLRHGTLHSVRWKPCSDELVSGRVWRCHGLWGVADSGLHPQCSRGKIFLRVNFGGLKRRFEGIWADVHAFSIAHSIVELVIAVPWIRFWGLERDL